MTGRRRHPLLCTFLLIGAMALGAASAVGDGAAYLGELPDGTLLYVQVEIGDDACASVRVRAAARANGRESLSFEAVGTPVWASRTLEIEAASRPASGGVATGGVELSLSIPLQQGSRTLDPFGAATMDLVYATIELRAIGSIYTSRAALADGSFVVERIAPFFYVEPWNALDLVNATRLGVVDAIDTGLEQRRDLPDSAAGFWSERRVARVMSLDAELVSVLFEDDAYTGGAHPNQWRSSATWIRDGGRWQRADLCGALGHLGLPCDRGRIASLVLADLRDQEAAWVVQGEVDDDTPWLLDTFTLVAGALRFDFSPYEVGPYAQGPFTVVVPFPNVSGRPLDE